MPTPGRNDPCPCGSGQKYKRCCGTTQTQVSIVVTDDDRHRAYAVLEPLTREHRFARQVDAAVDLLTGDEDWSESFQRGAVASWFVEWLSFDVPLDQREQTAADYALDRHAGDLTPGARRFIADMRDAPLKLLQVQTVFRAGFLLCRDLLDPPAIYRIRDTGEFERYDVLAGRLVNVSDVFEFGAEPGLIVSENRRRLVQQLRRMRKRALASGATPRLLRMLEAAQLVRLMTDSEAMLDGTLETAEGDPVIATRISMRLRDPGAFSAALAAAPDFATRPDDANGLTFNWLHRDERGRPAYALGHGAIHDDLLEAAAMSRQRAERMAARLRELGGNSTTLVGIDAIEMLEEEAEPDGNED